MADGWFQLNAAFEFETCFEISDLTSIMLTTSYASFICARQGGHWLGFLFAQVSLAELSVHITWNVKFENSSDSYVSGKKSDSY